MCWRTDGNFDNQAKFKEIHEYVLVYAKDAECFPHPPVVDPSTPQDSKVFRPEIRNTIVKNGPKNPVSEVELPAGFPCDVSKAEFRKQADRWPHYLSDAKIFNEKLEAPAKLRSGWSSKDYCLPSSMRVANRYLMGKVKKRDLFLPQQVP
jgi:adenine-specific DNA-methyltransferase